MLIANAYAQAAAQTVATPSGDPLMANLLLIGMLFMIFYVLLWRPQQQRAKAHKAMMENLRRGDAVVTAGGLLATVSKIISDDEVELQLADSGKVRAVKSTIASVTVRGEPVKSDAKPVEAEKKSSSRKKSAETAEKKQPQVSKPQGKSVPTVAVDAPANNQDSIDSGENNAVNS